MILFLLGCGGLACLLAMVIPNSWMGPRLTEKDSKKLDEAFKKSADEWWVSINSYTGRK